MCQFAPVRETAVRGISHGGNSVQGTAYTEDGDGEAAGSLATAGSCRYHPGDTEGYKEESDIVGGQGSQAGLDSGGRGYQRRHSHRQKTPQNIRGRMRKINTLASPFFSFSNFQSVLPLAEINRSLLPESLGNVVPCRTREGWVSDSKWALMGTQVSGPRPLPSRSSQSDSDHCKDA